MNTELLRKELRDIWPLGLLALLVAAWLALGDASYFLSISTYQHSRWHTMHHLDPGGRLIPLISESSRFAFGIMAVATGVILGLWQTWSETVRGTWGYLLHRPISRRAVLGHKLAAGAAVMLLAIGVPLAGLHCWALSSGNHLAALEWRMGADLRAACWTGTLAYLSAFLSGIRSARWYGSRYLVLGAGAIVAPFIWASGTLWGWAGLLTVVLDLMLLSAILHAAEERNFSDS